jgi:ABC-type transport system involved in multi-copper enzyme maturation permease subunit
MLLGPIFQVEMTTSARRARYFLIRGGYGLVLLIGSWIVYSDSSRLGWNPSIHAIAELNATLFITFAWLQMLAVVMLGPALSAGTIAVERERRTIEYLFATDLSNVEVVLGKLAARLALITCLVLVGLPILAIFRLLGGVSGELLLAVFAVTISSMLFIAVVSVCISVWSPRARDAVVRAYLVLGAFIVLPMILYATPRLSGWAPDWLRQANDFVLEANPLWALGRLFSGGGGPAGYFVNWEAVSNLAMIQLGVAAGGAVLATQLVRRVHLSASGKGDSAQRRWWRISLPQLIRPQIGVNPMIWKELFARHASTRLGVAGRVALALIVIAVLGITAVFFSNSLDASSYSWMGGVDGLWWYIMQTRPLLVCVATGGILLVAARAAGTVTYERERDCWTSLLATPLSGREIVLGKFHGACYAGRWLMLLMGGIWGLGLYHDIRFLFGIAFDLATLALVIAFASALGLFYSLRCTTSMRAMGATLVTLLVVGGGYMFCCMPIMSGNDGQFILAGCLPFLVIAPDMFFVDWISEGNHFGSDSEGEIVAAYIFGVIGYAVATLMLNSASIGNFERLAGRAVFDEFSANRQPRTLPDPEDLVAPEVVEEEDAEERL